MLIADLIKCIYVKQAHQPLMCCRSRQSWPGCTLLARPTHNRYQLLDTALFVRFEHPCQTVSGTSNFWDVSLLLYIWLESLLSPWCVQGVCASACSEEVPEPLPMGGEEDLSCTACPCSMMQTLQDTVRCGPAVCLTVYSRMQDWKIFLPLMD